MKKKTEKTNTEDEWRNDRRKYFVSWLKANLGVCVLNKVMTYGVLMLPQLPKSSGLSNKNLSDRHEKHPFHLLLSEIQEMFKVMYFDGPCIFDTELWENV